MAHNRKLRKLMAGLLAGAGLMLAALVAMGGATIVSAAGPITVNTTADELNTDGDCSLREAIQAANTDAVVDACAAGSGADVITFSLTTPAVITLTLGELTISADPLTIDGPGAAKLAVTANDASRVFNITSDVLVSISGLKAEHGNTVGDGGGLLSVGDVMLADAIFEENRSGDDGGAINVRGQLTMTNTDVLSNTSAGFGGGINTLLNPVRLTGGRIENNAAGSWAGGLYVNGVLSISGTQFISNSAHSYSGAIFAWKVMTATNARFERNTATTLDVGGVFVFQNAALTGTDFISNTASQRTGALFVRGDARLSGGSFIGNEAQGGTAGALNVDGALDIDGTRFVANTATGDGGALWYALDSLRIANATFAQNHSDGNGGAIEVRLPVTMTNTSFLTNTAAGQGGAVNASGASVDMTGGKFAGNHAGLAGGLYADGVVAVSGTRFISNSAQLFGGAILAWQDVTAANARFERNAAQGFNVGALYVNGNLTLTATDFISNTAAQNYGAAWVGGNATMTGGAATGNVAQSGGAGGFKVDGDFVADGAQFVGNRADSAAGALDVRGALTLTNTDVLNNVAGGDGGGINSFGPAVRLSGGEISRNTGAQGGGLRADGPITVTRTVFDGNTGYIGGGVDVDNSGWFSGTAFSGNTSLAHAGALHATGSLWLTDSGFISNTAGSEGGAIVVHLNTVMSNTDFISNTARSGVGGGVSAGVAVSMVNSRFWANSASGNGGGLIASFGPVTATRSDFSENSSGDAGGGLYTGGRVSLDDTYFAGNSARTFGGGLFGWQTVDVVYGLFASNTATDFSVGALYANSDLSITGSGFYRNTAALRDGAVWAGGDASISFASFEGNQARGGRAGALDVGGSLSITGAGFISNTAQSDGGALVVGGSLWMTQTSFLSNTAQSDGGGLALLGDDARLVNVGFWDNGAGGQGGAMALKHSGAVDVFHTSIDGPVTPGSSAVQVNASGRAAFTDTIFSGYATGINLAAGSAREDYNLFNQSAAVSGPVTRGGHSVAGNPMFDSSFRLAAGSWAINAGVETRFTADFFGNTRPAGGAVDVGWEETAFTSDAAIAKTVFVTPFPSPGQAITYTLTFSNVGQSALYGLVITDEIPSSITGTTFAAAGATVTDTGISPAYVWQVGNLAMGGRGVITVSGTMANPLAWGVFTNTAVITTSSPDANPANNVSDVTVLVVNAPPVAVPDVFTTAEDTAIGLTPLLNDVDDNPLLVAGVSAPAHGTAVISGAETIIYTPTLNFYGVDSFSYMASDTDLTDTTTITVHVTPVNDAPVAVADQPAGLEDTPLTIDPLANDTDVDGDSLALTALGTAGHGTAVISGTTQVIYTPTLHFNGVDVFSYTVGDGALTGTATITVTVVPVNDAPVAGDDAATTPEDTPVTITPLGNDTDIDGDALFITTLTGPLHGTIALPGGSGSFGTAILSGTQSILYTPAPDFFGLDSLGYIVSDGALTDTATISITVTPVNDAPVAVGDSHMQLENTTGSISPLGNDTDVDGDSLFISAVDAPAHGTAVISGGTQVLYTPDTNFFGADSFRYTVSDGALTDTATITVTVAQTIWFNYLPLALSRYSYAPDLVVSDLVAAENAVTVTIKNIGVAPVTGGFWVDVYIAPSPVPTQVNQIWPDVAAQGLVWGVDGDALAQLTPGGSLTLTIGDGLFDAGNSHFTGGLLSGTPVYAQVDSVNLATTFGGVRETHEITGGAYNNITGVLAGSGSGTFPPPVVGLGRGPGHLPAR